MDGAHGALLSIAGGSDLGLFEINEAASLVQESAHPDANIIFGTIIDDSLGDEVRVTVIAAGFDAGAPTHKKLDPPDTFGTRGSGTGSEKGSASSGSGAGAREQRDGAARTPHGEANNPTPPVARRTPPPAGQGSQSGSLPTTGTTRGYSVPSSSPSPSVHRTQGNLSGRSFPVNDDPSDDDVDVPPFMRR
jgi:cell division protein FtsZ